MTILRLAVLLLLASACWRRDYVPSSSMLRSDQAGVYDTEVSVVSSSCAGITVEDAPVVVERMESSPSALRLSSRAETYIVRLGRNGSFSGQSSNLRTRNNRYADGVRIRGRFRGDTLTARITVTDGRRRCGYVVEWAGTRA